MYPPPRTLIITIAFLILDKFKVVINNKNVNEKLHADYKTE